MTDSEIIQQFYKDIRDIFLCKMGVVDKCIMVSELPPDQWKECVLWPDRDGVTIFGHQQVAMSREKTISIVDALTWCGLCESNGEVRKAIKNNGIKINRKLVTDFRMTLSKENALPNIDAIVLEFGKYNFGIIELC